MSRTVPLYSHPETSGDNDVSITLLRFVANRRAPAEGWRQRRGSPAAGATGQLRGGEHQPRCHSCQLEVSAQRDIDGRHHHAVQAPHPAPEPGPGDGADLVGQHE